MRTNLLLTSHTRTSLSRQSNIHSINIKSKILQRMRISHSFSRVLSSQLQTLGV